ncbi:MAG TPA: hypothetical protein VI874_04495, partial [Candidatus Norongarragalinales archaeon]|nr:hypothetical protein [Candidatus Norongarragalinales archaeon]
MPKKVLFSTNLSSTPFWSEAYELKNDAPPVSEFESKTLIETPGKAALVCESIVRKKIFFPSTATASSPIETTAVSS